MLRMKTSSSCACACMRNRSPRTAPPLKGLVGSTAITPTRCAPCVLKAATSRSTSVLFPAPGGPVTPTRYARPVCAKMPRTTSALDGSSSSMSEMARAMARGAPASTRSGNDKVTLSRAVQKLARDHEPLDFARALADGQEFHVAEVLFGRVVLHKPVTTVDLDAVVGHLHRNLARVELRHRRLQRRPVAAILQVRGPVRAQPRGLDAGRRVGELPLDRLELADRLAEGFPFLRVSERSFVRALGEPHRQGGNADTPRVEHLHRVHEALALIAQQLIGGNAAVVEQHFARVARTHPQLVFLLARRHSRRAVF